MAKYSKTEITEAKAQLRKWLKPGDTVHTILDHVSRSGMSRDIRVLVIKCDNGEPVHSLGYALFGEEAEYGTGKEANALRKAIYEADKFYWHQQGKKDLPDWTKPGREWFAGAGYALKHRWL